MNSVMPELILAESRRASSSPKTALSTRVESTGPAPESFVAPTVEQIWVTQIRDELDAYFVELKRLAGYEPDRVMLFLSSCTARLSEIRMLLCRRDSRRTNALRTREVDPLIEECDRQFRVHSRLLAIRQMDWEQSGKGQV